jgi:glycosyltransferase involved in cell wall biosynthesis
MGRYAEILAQSLSHFKNETLPIKVTVRRLALPFCRPKWLPAGLYAWLNHAWLYLSARFRLRHSDVDLVHILDGSYAYVAARGGPPTVATVHDLIPWLRYQGRFGSDRGSLAAVMLVKRAFAGLRRCDYLLAVSENTAEDLREHTGIQISKLSVAPVALASPFGEAANASAYQTSINADPQYILHVGNNGFYKNRAGVIRIFARLDDQSDLHLVIAGAAPEAALIEQVRDLSIQDRVVFVEDIDDERLVQLYTHATLLLFPSLYEGFGWPPLEAMACGCPVVCSSEGSLREVAGPAALMAPAADESGLADLCQSILEDYSLAEQMSEKGRAHARQFTLERMAQQTIEAYKSAIHPQTSRHRA